MAGIKQIACPIGGLTSSIKTIQQSSLDIQPSIIKDIGRVTLQLADQHLVMERGEVIARRLGGRGEGQENSAVVDDLSRWLE
jgi:hypothetical protein